MRYPLRNGTESGHTPEKARNHWGYGTTTGSMKERSARVLAPEGAGSIGVSVLHHSYDRRGFFGTTLSQNGTLSGHGTSVTASRKVESVSDRCNLPARSDSDWLTDPRGRQVYRCPCCDKATAQLHRRSGLRPECELGREVAGA